MNEQASVTNLDAWVISETQHVDVVTSWESLCTTYDAMKFVDPMTDMERLGEYKWITHNMNSFLSKMRKKLLSCKDEDDMREAMIRTMNQTTPVDLSTRKALVYQKLRQTWLMNQLRTLELMMNERDSYGE